ncbi:MAG TPA: hypothetical protein VEI97_14890 [bacterium]|nr:hypothetical protein [bacterium]
MPPNQPRELNDSIRARLAGLPVEDRPLHEATGGSEDSECSTPEFLSDFTSVALSPAPSWLDFVAGVVLATGALTTLYLWQVYGGHPAGRATDPRTGRPPCR